ncbi:hypothetical protein M758_5G081000 [Ceratodon purpureus]|nr:hypothetical protein M758_5G081000 [Ceratodon purpureus]
MRYSVIETMSHSRLAASPSSAALQSGASPVTLEHARGGLPSAGETHTSLDHHHPPPHPPNAHLMPCKGWTSWPCPDGDS